MTARIKSTILASLVVLDSALLWFFVERILYGNGPWPFNLIWGSLIFINLSALVGALFVASSDTPVVSLGLLGSTLTALLVVPWKGAWLLLIALAVWLLAYQFILKEKTTRLVPDVIALWRRGWKLYFVGVILVISIAYFYSPVTSPAVLTNSILDSVDLVLNSVYSVTPEVRDTVTTTIEQQLDTIINQPAFSTWVPAGLSAGLFLGLLGLGVVFYWLTCLALLVTIWLLKKINFIRQYQEPCQKTTIGF